MRLHGCYVCIVEDRTLYTSCTLRTDEVVVVTSIPVEREVDSVVEETEVDTEVELVLLLVCQVRVSEAVDLQTRFLVNSVRTPYVVATDDYVSICDGRLVTGQRVTCLNSSVRENLVQFLEPCLLMSVPCSRDVPCRQPAGACSLTQTVRTLVAYSTVDCITALPRICSSTEERNLTAVAVAYRVVH